MKKIYETLRTTRTALTMLLLGIFMLAANVARTQEVTVVTDKDDYMPGEWVIIDGTGWTADDSVMLTLIHIEPNIPEHTHDSWKVEVLADGTFHYEWFVFEQELGTAFELTAEGMTTGLKAMTYFTDDVSVTAATGGTNILADKAANATSPSFTTLTTSISIKEANGSGGRNDFHTDVTQIVLNAPSGWQFQTSGGTIGGTHADITVGAITYTTSTITISLTVNSITNNDELTFSGVAVRANDGAVIPNSGNITPTWTGTIDVLTTSSNLGSLSQTFGAINKIVVTLPNETFTDGATVATSGNSGSVTAQTVGTSFNIAKLTATDQFYNIVTTFTGSKTISYSGPGTGSVAPSYTTTVSFTNGQSTTTLATTLTKAETTTITATNASTSGPASSSLVVNKANTTTNLTSETNPSVLIAALH